MATQVEVSSALATLAGIREPRNEAVLRHPFLSSLRDASRKPGEDPGSLAPLILEGGNKQGGPVRPRLTPKPFSREMSSDTFAAVKPPVLGLKPSGIAPKPPTIAQTSEGAAKGLTGNIPPLLDQKSLGSKSPRELVANTAFCLSPQANPVTFFERERPERERPEGRGSPLKAREGQLLSSPSERWFRRQSSRPTDPRPVPRSPHGSLERQETFLGAPKGSASSVELQQHPSLAAEMHPWAHGKPASSAVFLESCQEQTQPTPPESASGLSVQKPWALSTDLAGRIENGELSSQKKLYLTESREKSFVAASGWPLEPVGAQREAAGLSVASPCGPRVDSAGQLAAALCARSSTQSLWPSAGGVAPLGQTVSEDPWENSAQDRKDPWGLECQGRPSVGQYNASQGLALGERVELTAKETGLRNASPPDTFNRGCVKKTSVLLDTSANSWTPVAADSPLDCPGKENLSLNIQQRIKELTAENTNFKPESLRRSFRARPLSTDLTKVFSGPVTASAMKPKRQPDRNRKSDGKTQDIREDETLPAGATDLREASMVGSPRKPSLLAKTLTTEGPPGGEGSFANGRQNVSLPGEHPGLVLSPKANTFSGSPPEDACLKTVRATMFEHHVQRHSVVASHLGAEPSLLSLMGSFGESLSCGQELRKERVLGFGQSTKGPAWEAEAPEEARRPKDPRPSTEDHGSLAVARAEDSTKEQCEKPASKGRAEDSLLCQRIEPRYEILQTVGERARSEAVTAIPEGKALTLRRERSLKESQRAEGKSDPQPEGPALGTRLWKDPPAAWGQRPFRRGGTGLDRYQAGQQLASEKAAPFTSRTKDDGTFAPCLEAAEEKKLAPASAMEGSATLDCFPERTGTGPPEADSCESRAGVLGQEAPPSLASGHSGQAAPPRTRQWQRASCPGLPSSLDLELPYEPDEPRGQKGRLAARGAPGRLDGVMEGHSRQPDPEARWQSSFHNVSTPKVSDRRRRKTLPHGTVGFEGIQEPSCGTAELVSRRDSLAKRSPQTQYGVGPRQVEVTSPSRLQKQLSPSEPKATYFAVTCQISQEINNEPGRDVAVAPRWSSSRTADPSHYQHRECFSGTASSPDRSLSERRGGRGASDLLEKGASERSLTEAREQAREQLQREPEEAEGHLAGADPPLCPVAQSPSRSRPLQQDSRPDLQKRSGAPGLGRAEEKAADHYRSRVVDIDELMAEYGGESPKVCGMEDQKESSLFPWEKLPSRRNFPGNLPCSSEQREMLRVELSSGSRRTGMDASSCENGRVCGSDLLDVLTQESSPLRAREGKHSPPHWGRPDLEKTKCWSAEPVGPRTKTSFFDSKEQGEDTRPGPQSTKGAVRMDLGALWKEASPKQWAVLAPAGGWCPSGDWGGNTGRKVDSHAGVWEKDSPVAQTGMERSSATPDFKGPSLEKTHRAHARPGLPLGVRPGQHHVCRSFPPERPGAWLSRGGPCPRDCCSHEGERDLEKESLQEDRDDAGTRCSSHLLMQRRSHSFHRERRTDHWPGDHLKQCFGRPAAEARDTDVLVQEADSRYGTWEDQRHSGGSFVPESPSLESSVAPAQKPPPSSRASLFSSQTDLSSKEQRSTSPEDSSPEARPADGASASPPTGACLDFSFLEQTPRLDSRALKSRALLGKRRQQHRAPISHALRRGAGGDAEWLPTPSSGMGEADSGWMFRDSTEEKPTRGGGLEEEEESPPAERLPPSQPRLPLFPGLPSSVLKAQLRKRHESEGREEAIPAPLCKSPKGPFQAGVSGGRAVMAVPEERLGEPPPRWLEELKSRTKQGRPRAPSEEDSG